MDANNGGSVKSQPCSPGNSNQLWVWVWANQDKSFGQLQWSGSSVCLGEANDQSMSTTQCNAFLPRQRFFPIDATTGLIRSGSPGSAACLNDGGGNTGKWRLGMCADAANLTNMQFEAVDPKVLQSYSTVSGPLRVGPRPIMIRSVNAAGSCMDANVGGSVHSWGCSSVNDNQVWVWVWADQAKSYGQLQLSGSAPKAGSSNTQLGGANSYCLDDSGATRSGQVAMKVWSCDPKNQNQFFYAISASTKLIRSYYKTGLCVNNGGGSTGTWWLWDCNNSINDMQFEALDARAFSADSDKVPFTNQLFQLGQQSFQLKANKLSNICLGGSGSGVRGQACDSSSADQQLVFVWADQGMRTGLIQKKGTTQCLDDGGTTNGGDWSSNWGGCSVANTNQHWSMDDQGQIRSYWKRGKNLCLDVGKDTSGTAWLYTCSANNNQLFSLQTLGTLENVLVPFANGRKFLLQEAKKQLNGMNVCYDASFNANLGTGTAHAWGCDASNPNQVLAFVKPDSSTPAGMLMLPMLDGAKCVDDIGSWPGGSSRYLGVADCDPSSVNQFFYLQKNGLLASFFKKGLCVDDGGGSVLGATNMWLWTCDGNYNQLFNVSAWMV